MLSLLYKPLASYLWVFYTIIIISDLLLINNAYLEAQLGRTVYMWYLKMINQQNAIWKLGIPILTSRIFHINNIDQTTTHWIVRVKQNVPAFSSNYFHKNNLRILWSSINIWWCSMHRAVGPSQSTLRPLLLLEHCANIHLKREDLGNSLCWFLKHCFFAFGYQAR